MSILEKSLLPINIESLENPKEWKIEYENIVCSWRKLAAINMWLSLASKYMYERINNWLSYPSVVLSVITSIGIIGLDTCNRNVASFIVSGFVLTAAILTTMNKHIGAAEKSHEFYVRSKEYYSIIREIDYLLALNKNDRPDVDDTMVRLNTNLGKIIDNQMDFPLRIVHQYEKKFRSLESSLMKDLEGEKKHGNIDGIEGKDLKEDVESKMSGESTFDFERFGNDRLKKSLSLSRTKKGPLTTPRSKSHRRNSTLLMPYQLYVAPDIMSPYNERIDINFANRPSFESTILPTSVQWSVHPTTPSHPVDTIPIDTILQNKLEIDSS
jgi:hypothetical protein